MLTITEDFIPVKTKRRSGQSLLGVAFLVSHDTGNDGSTAQENVNYYINSDNAESASAHFFVDDKKIICCIPEGEKAWHVRYNVPIDNDLYGRDANDWSIGIELCFDSQNSVINNLKAYREQLPKIS